MKKWSASKRVIGIALVAGFLGLIGIAGVYLKYLGGWSREIVSKERRLQYCGRCGFQEWHISKELFGLRIQSRAPLKDRKRNFAGIDQESCKHAFCTIGFNDFEFTVPGFKAYRFSMGTLTNNAFWEKPMLVEIYRAMDRDDEEDAASVFNHFIIAPSYRGKVSTNILKGLEGTNSRALVEMMYTLYENDGRKLKKRK